VTPIPPIPRQYQDPEGQITDLSYNAQTANSAAIKIHQMVTNLYTNTSWIEAAGALRLIYAVF